MARKNTGLVTSIVFASFLISGSLVYLGMNVGGGLSDKELQTKIFKGIDDYIAEKQKAYQKEQNTPQIVEGDFTDDDPFLGDEDAPVTIVEFSDFQCPYCKIFQDETFPQIKSDYIDAGKVKFVYRDLPLGIHPNAYPAALFADCVNDQKGSDAYFKTHDKLFAALSEGDFDFDQMSEFALSLGVDGVKLKDCFDTEKFKDEIDADSKAASSVGIGGTPAFIINNKLVSGAQPFDVFKEVIDAEL